MYTTSSEPASIVKKLTYFTVSSLRLWRIWIVPPSIGETKYSFNLPAWISSFSIVASDGWFGIRSESTCRNMWCSFCEKLVGIDGDLAILSEHLLEPNSATQAAYPSTDNAYCLSRHILRKSGFLDWSVVVEIGIYMSFQVVIQGGSVSQLAIATKCCWVPQNVFHGRTTLWRSCCIQMI